MPYVQEKPRSVHERRTLDGCSGAYDLHRRLRSSKDLLESGGVPVVLRSSKVSPYPVNIGKIGEIKILVRDEDKEIAEKLIKEEIDISE